MLHRASPGRTVWRMAPSAAGVLVVMGVKAGAAPGSAVGGEAAPGSGVAATSAAVSPGSSGKCSTGRRRLRRCPLPPSRRGSR